jgi:hypothetical protein
VTQQVALLMNLKTVFPLIGAKLTTNAQQAAHITKI